MDIFLVSIQRLLDLGSLAKHGANSQVAGKDPK